METLWDAIIIHKYPQIPYICTYALNWCSLFFFGFWRKVGSTELQGQAESGGGRSCSGTQGDSAIWWAEQTILATQKHDGCHSIFIRSRYVLRMSKCRCFDFYFRWFLAFPAKNAEINKGWKGSNRTCSYFSKISFPTHETFHVGLYVERTQSFAPKGLGRMCHDVPQFSCCSIPIQQVVDLWNPFEILKSQKYVEILDRIDR